MQTLQGTLTSLNRLKSSTNGNPRYQFVVSGEIVCTAPDCTLGYDVCNFQGKNVLITARVLRNKLTLVSIKEA